MESHVTPHDHRRDIPSPVIFYWLEPSHRAHPHSKRGNYSRVEHQKRASMRNTFKFVRHDTTTLGFPSWMCIQKKWVKMLIQHNYKDVHSGFIRYLSPLLPQLSTFTRASSHKNCLKFKPHPCLPLNTLPATLQADLILKPINLSHLQLKEPWS